jgi:hypothetical protein
MKESKFNEIEQALNIETSLVESNVSESKIIEVPDDPRKDYEYTRANLYNLIEKGQEAINGILEVAQSSDHPRAYEVAGQLIKSVGDVSDKLLDLQKKMKDLDAPVKGGPTTVNNALFVGSTAELSKLIKQGLLNNVEE